MLILYMGVSLIVAVTTLIFTVLKIAGTITWDWLWVLSPMWGAWSMLFLMLIAVAIHLHIEGNQKKKPAEAGNPSGVQKRCDFFRGLTR